MSLLDRGFVIAIAHVRGGAELGEGWYAARRMMNKNNTFSDFVDATRALVQAGWGADDKVLASGGSAGAGFSGRFQVLSDTAREYAFFIDQAGLPY